MLVRRAVAILVLLVPCVSVLAQGTLTIHQINVQQGDCTLIVGPDGTTFLIDAGNRGKGTSEVVPYLRSIGIEPDDGLDFMLATHRDSDHLGGLDEVIGAGYDVGEAVWDNGSSKTGGPDSQITQFLTAAAGTTAGAVQAMPLNHEVALGGGATAICVAVGGRVRGHGLVAGATSENDMSVALLVRFGDFEYITAGDLGGGQADRTCTGRSTGQANVETPLALALMPGSPHSLLTADGVEVLDVNHHGSESSTNRDYMNQLSPALAVINTGRGQGGNFHHPRRDVVENVLMAAAACVTATAAVVLQTEEGSPIGTNTTRAAFCVGDIVIRTTGRSNFQVSATGRRSQGPDERMAAGLNPARTFPLDGAGAGPAGDLVIVEIMRNPASVSDARGEWFEIFNPGSAAIDINGWTIRDNDSDSHEIDNGSPLLVPAGGVLVLGRNGVRADNGGYVAGYVYRGFFLANIEDEIELVDATGRVVDQVAYTGTGWPRPNGRSIQVRDHTGNNNSAANWQQAPTRGGTYTGSGTDRGTPGAL